MKILFCSPASLSKDLGASKVLIELAEELERLNWTCDTICPSDLAASQGSLLYAEKLRKYLHQHAAKYDVIDYDHGHLPYPRTEFHSRTLFVARSQLLGHHFENIPIPLTKSWKSRIRFLLKGKREETMRQQRTRFAQITVKEADLVNVLNYEDKAELIKWRIPAEKIVVVPNGISRSRRLLFDAISSKPPPEPKVAFVGTFTERKGAADFPAIVQSISQALPKVSYRLIGTAMTKEKVLAHFPKKLRKRIEVISRFDPEDLPKILASCSVGIFPSYIEGFGLGVLEMLAASVPVIAYNSPGPPMMLPPDYLVSPGDTKNMSAKAIDLLSNITKLSAARSWTKQQSQKFSWQQIAQDLSQVYLEFWQKINKKS